MAAKFSRNTRIAIAITMVLVVFACIFWWQLFLTLLLLIPLGAVVGPWMALTYPFSVAFKVGYSALLLLSLAGIVYGVIRRSTLKGKTLLWAGILLWIGCGLIGLGTGT